jgi:hypothetical protein
MNKRIIFFILPMKSNVYRECFVERIEKQLDLCYSICEILYKYSWA